LRVKAQGQFMQQEKTFSLSQGSTGSFRLILVLVIAAALGCTSYRTFNSLHWAKEAFKQGKLAQEEQQRRARQGSSYLGTRTRKSKVVGGEHFEEAARKCLYFLSQNPEGRRTDDALMLMGQAFYELRRFVQAENSLKKLLETQKKSKYRDDAQYYLVLIMLEREETTLAELGIERLQDEFPKSKYIPLAKYHLGEKYFELGEYERALEVFFDIRDNHPKFKLKGDVLSYLARIYFEMEDYENALPIYQQLYKEGRDDLQKREGFIGMARCKSRMGLHEEALAIYQEALRTAKFEEEKAEALLGINVEYTFLQRPQEAMEGFEEIVLEYPRTQYSAAAWYEIGLLYKDFHENPFVDSIALDSTALKVFALSRKRLEMLEKEQNSQRLLALRLAAMAFRKVRSEDPNSPLAEPADRQVRDVQNLYDIFQQMEASDSTTSRDALARLQFLLAEYHESTGEIELARAEYERLIFEYPNSIWTPKAVLNIARLSRELGDSARYVQALELVVANFPDTRYADRARELLGLPVPERPPGFYLDELAGYVAPKITRAAKPRAAPAGKRAIRAGPGRETYLQMRRRLWWERFGSGGGA